MKRPRLLRGRRARAITRPGPARGARGYGLIEIMVVVVIVGITLMLGFQGLASAFKRQKLAAASADFKVFAQRAQIEMQRRNAVAFLRVRPWTDQGTPIQLILDTNGNTQPDDAVVATYTLPAEVALSTANATAQAFNAQWVAPGDGTHYLECDFQGRAFNPVTTQQISAPATVPLSHRDMVGGSLTPMVVYTLSINPVWNASITQSTPP